MRYNNATPASVTEIYIDDLDAFGNDIGVFFQSALDNKGYLYLKSNDNADTTVNVFRVLNETAGAGYQKITVTFEAGAAIPSNGEALSLTFSRDGATGATGPSGPAAFPSAQAAFLSGTQQYATTVTATFNQMTIPIASGQMYSIRAMLPYNSDGNSGGIRLGLLFPAARRAFFRIKHPVLAGQTATLNYTDITASTQSVLVASGTTIPQLMEVDGILLASAAGNLMFFGAAEAANLTARFLDGGHIIVWNLGPQAV